MARKTPTLHRELDSAATDKTSMKDRFRLRIDVSLKYLLLLQLMDNTIIKSVNLNKIFYVKVHTMKSPNLAVTLPSNEKNAEE